MAEEQPKVEQTTETQETKENTITKTDAKPLKQKGFTKPHLNRMFL